jgi:molybdopterin synthase catalytic subunit
MQDFILISPEKLEIGILIDKVRDDRAGAISTFIGTTRNTFKGEVTFPHWFANNKTLDLVNGHLKTVLTLEYEAYTPMAIKSLYDLARQIRKTWPSISKIVIAHRTGVVDVGEESVIIAISSPHRKDSLESVHWCIDELKRVVPIWKREIYTDGSCWKSNCIGCT